jgi:hypothetical protein
MADLASSAVTVLDEHRIMSMSGSGFVVKRVSVALTAQGNTSDTIPASALGLVKLLMACPISEDDGSEMNSVAIHVGTNSGNSNGATAEDIILIKNPGTAAPTTITAKTFHFFVMGTD